MSIRTACLIVALGLLGFALFLEIVPSKLPGKPFETGGLLAFVASFVVGP